MRAFRLQRRLRAFIIQAENAAIRTEGGPNPGGGWNLWSNGRVGQSIRVAAAGKYQVIARAWGSPAGGIWPEMALLVDGRAVKTVSVGSAQRADYRFDVELAAGIHEVAAADLNDAVIGKEDRHSHRKFAWLNRTHYLPVDEDEGHNAPHPGRHFWLTGLRGGFPGVGAGVLTFQVLVRTY